MSDVQEVPCIGILFALQDSLAKQQQQKDAFLAQRSFWAPHLARLCLVCRLVGVSLTEAPDGHPALLLVVQQCRDDHMLEWSCQQVAKDLASPAYVLSAMWLKPEEVAELRESSPWD